MQLFTLNFYIGTAIYLIGMAIVMWVGIASGIWLLVILALLLGVISHPFLKAQERFCIDKYGEEYLKYIERTPRYLII